MEKKKKLFFLLLAIATSNKLKSSEDPDDKRKESPRTHRRKDALSFSATEYLRKFAKANKKKEDLEKQIQEGEKNDKDTSKEKEALAVIYKKIAELESESTKQEALKKTHKKNKS